MQFYRIFMLSLFLFSYVLDATLHLETVYGELIVDDPLAIELIESESFQRLKGINQYGLTSFLIPTENYKRYEHSLGVYFLLKKHGRPQIEQIAGLLHDVSHTAFSHVGDYVFGSKPGFIAFQDEIHSWYLKESGLSKTLEKYNIAVEELKPENFPLLKNKLPNLCADRIDYNLQGGFLRGLISKEEMNAIWQDLHVESGKWLLSSEKNAENLANVSLIMTETLWGSPWESIVNRIGAKVIKYSIENSIITLEEFHFGKDDSIWDKLLSSKDPFIKEMLLIMQHLDSHFIVVEKGKEDFLIFEKFRGIDPLLENGLKLSEINPFYFKNFHLVKQKMEVGWPIIWLYPKKIIEMH